jgi:hypothetical protein
MGFLIKQEILKDLYEAIRHKMNYLLGLIQENGYLTNDQQSSVELQLRQFLTFLFLDTDQFGYINQYVENITSDKGLISYFAEPHSFKDIQDNLKNLLKFCP